MPPSCPQVRITTAIFTCIVLLVVLFAIGYQFGSQAATDSRIAEMSDFVASEWVTTDPPTPWP